MERCGAGCPGPQTSSPSAFIVDADAGRAARAAGILEKLGSSVSLLRRPPPAFPLSCKLALVAVDPADPGPALACLRVLRGARIRSLAYGCGSAAWAIARRCEPLAAGAAALLDSASGAFESVLAEQAGRFLEQERERSRTADVVKARMRDLGIIGESPAIVSVFQAVLRISGFSDLPVLLTGETGAGKEMFARALHRLDPRRSRGPLVPVNCGAIAPGIAESELFGHRRGAFTGADQDRKGLFRAADGGVLFLDEVHELRAGMQTRLLRVLQDSRVIAVGDEREVTVDVRVIAASNRRLTDLVEAGKFRADLYHRLDAFTVRIPPLRERPEDMGPLVEHFIAKHGKLAAVPVAGAAPDFLEALRNEPMPGNVRQLENILRWVLINKDSGGALRLSDLPNEILRRLAGPPPPGPPGDPPRLPMAASASQAPFDRVLEDCQYSLARSLEYCERRLIEAAMLKAQGNQSRAARMMGVTARSVYNKLRKHGLWSGARERDAS